MVSGVRPSFRNISEAKSGAGCRFHNFHSRGLEREETSKMLFNLHPALCPASKSFLNTCLVLYLVTIIVVKCKHPLLLFRSSVRKILKQVWYFARLFVLWLSPKVLPLGNPQTSLVFRSLIRTFAHSYAEA